MNRYLLYPLAHTSTINFFHTDRCPNSSRCINTPGSYYCVCKSGWEKVFQFQCVDIDECSRGIHGCDRNSYCVNTAGSWKCVCNNGWYPDPTNARLPTCRDVNECVDKPNACPQESTCINSAGSYRCDCNRCFYKSGSSCNSKCIS